MKRSLPALLLSLVLCTAAATAQPTGSRTPEFRLNMMYQDQQLTQRVAFGYDPVATWQQDTAFGEEVYPNFGGPGAGVAYFDYPGVIDYGTRVMIAPKPTTDSFFIQYNVHFYGSVYPGTVTWDPSAIPSIIKGITITPTGQPSKILVDMKQASSASIVTTNFQYHDWENAVITVFYNMSPRVMGVRDEPHYAGLISNLSAYPNPFIASSRLAFDLADASEITVQAFDVTGKAIGKLSQVKAGRTEVDLTELIPTSGAYFVRVQASSPKGFDERTILVRKN
jgi:hypothetical protein